MALLFAQRRTQEDEIARLRDLITESSFTPGDAHAMTSVVTCSHYVRRLEDELQRVHGERNALMQQLQASRKELEERRQQIDILENLRQRNLVRFRKKWESVEQRNGEETLMRRWSRDRANQ